jgi:hypothetical protein
MLSARRVRPLSFRVSADGYSIITPRTYRGFTITPRTFQVRGSNRWTIDFLITRNGSRRAYCDPATCPTESAAIEMCLQLGCRIIDRSARDCAVADLMDG